MKSRMAILLQLLTLLPPAASGAPAAALARITNRPFAPGESGHQASRPLAMTPDGRFVLLHTRATNLVAGFPDTNGLPDLLVYDRLAGSFDWITISCLDPGQPALGDGLGATISADGRFVAFESSGRRHAAGSEGHDPRHVYLFDRETRATAKVSHPAGDPLGPGNGPSSGPRLSADGRFLAYESDATNLVAGADGNGGTDVFLYDRLGGTSVLVSHRFAEPGTAAAARSGLRGLSADGRYVLFSSAAGDLLAGFLDGNGGQEDLYLWDRDSGDSRLVSHAAGSPLAGANAGVTAAQLSADGSRAAFSSPATDLVAGFTDGNGNEADVFVFERASGNLQLVSGVSPSETHSRGAALEALSAGGEFLFFTSPADDVLPGLVRPADGGDGLFRFTTATRAIALINHRAGQPAAVALGGGGSARIAPDGEALLFVSSGSELVAGQSSGVGRQTFAYDLAAGAARLVSHRAGDHLAGAPGEPVAPSADHRFAAFFSDSPLLAAGDRDDRRDDAFLYDLAAGSVNRLSSAAGPGLAASEGRYGLAESVPAAGLFLFQADDLPLLLPGASPSGSAPVLFDPRSGALGALLAPADAPASGSSRASFLADGLHFLLHSSGNPSVPGMIDGNGPEADLYAGNRRQAGLQLISTSAASSPAAPVSGNRGIGSRFVFSASGRLVAYGSYATDAVAGAADGNGREDVILDDRQLGTRTLVSRAAAPPLAAGNGASSPVAMSADGELLLIASQATDLMSGFTDLNGAAGADLFLYRRSTGNLTLVSHAAGSATLSGDAGCGSSRLSADGRWVVFESGARNLVAGMSDRNGAGSDLFVYDTTTGATSLASHVPGQPLAGADGEVRLAQVTADGRFVLLSSRATDLLGPAGFFPGVSFNTFVYDRLRDRTTLISHLPGLPWSGTGENALGETMSGDGRYVVFRSAAPNLVAGQQLEALATSDNFFLADRATGKLTLVSRGLSGPATAGNRDSVQLALGPGGREALFVSESTNLAPHQAVAGLEVYFADLSAGGGALFSDGFELGDTSAWSQTLAPKAGSSLAQPWHLSNFMSLRLSK